MSATILKYPTIILAALVSLSGCGGGDDSVSEGGLTGGDNSIVISGAGSKNSTPLKRTGYFIDSPVSNLAYTTDTLSGVTGDDGSFEYMDGEKIVFSIAEIQFKEVSAQPVITPATMYEGNALNTVLVMLQSLDENFMLEDGIQLKETIHNFTLDGEIVGGIDFENLTDEMMQKVIALVLFSGSGTLIQTNEALEHFNDSIRALENSGATSIPLTGKWIIKDQSVECGWSYWPNGYYDETTDKYYDEWDERLVTGVVTITNSGNVFNYNYSKKVEVDYMEGCNSDQSTSGLSGEFIAPYTMNHEQLYQLLSAGTESNNDVGLHWESITIYGDNHFRENVTILRNDGTYSSFNRHWHRL